LGHGAFLVRIKRFRCKPARQGPALLESSLARSDHPQLQPPDSARALRSSIDLLHPDAIGV
jgi:hypothetical protein